MKKKLRKKVERLARAQAKKMLNSVCYYLNLTGPDGGTITLMSKGVDLATQRLVRASNDPIPAPFGSLRPKPGRAEPGVYEFDADAREWIPMEAMQ